MIRIDPATLAVAGALAHGEAVDPDDVGKVRVLLRAELAVQPADLRLPPVLDVEFGRLVQVLTAARLAAHVQRFTGCRTSTSTVLVAGHAGVVVEHDPTGLCLLTAIDGADAAAAAARLVGFDGSPDDLAVEAPPAPPVLDQFHAHLIGGDPTGAADLLERGVDLDGRELELLLALVTGANHSWRVLTRDAALTVVDGGRRGLWRAGGIGQHPADQRLRPTSPAEVWAALAEVLAPAVAAVEAA